MAHRYAGMASALGLIGLALVVDPRLVSAQGAAAARHTRVSLVAETDAVSAGTPLTVAIRLQMEPGWHTYWRNPGDSGLPTRVKWTLPAGFEAGELRWPYPERFASGPLVSFGYEKEVLLPVEIRPPAALDGNEVRLAARVDWLECQDVCLPGKAEVSLTLPVRAGRACADAAAFAEARKRLPAVDPSWRFGAKPEAGALALSFRPPRPAALGNAHFYPTTPHVFDYSQPEALERTKTGYRLRLPRDPNGATPARLSGVLVIDVDGRTRAYEVDVAL